MMDDSEYGVNKRNFNDQEQELWDERLHELIPLRFFKISEILRGIVQIGLENHIGQPKNDMQQNSSSHPTSICKKPWFRPQFRGKNHLQRTNNGFLPTNYTFLYIRSD